MPSLSAAFPGLLDHLDALVSSPSISSANDRIDMSNAAVIDYLATCFTELGFSAEVIHSNSTSGQLKSNLIATLGTGPGGLVLAGHTDTVPLDEKLWHVDPFRLTQKDGKLYGLGSTDMKGFFPIIMEAAKGLRDLRLRHPLIVLATADEESSMEGARSLAAAGKPKARYAVVGEPTGLKPIRAHKGIMMESIRLQGQSGHSSDAALGRNALEAMHDVIGELLLYRQELQRIHRNPAFAIECPSLNLGCIHGGDNPNRICGHCELEFDIRLLPGMHIDDIRTNLEQRLRPIADRHDVAFTLHPLFPGIPAFESEADSDLVKTAERLTGHQAESVAFGTESPFLRQLGMDTIVLGPGDIKQAHQPDEFMALDQVQPCVDLLKSLIKHYCLSN